MHNEYRLPYSRNTQQIDLLNLIYLHVENIDCVMVFDAFEVREWESIYSEKGNAFSIIFEAIFTFGLQKH